MKILYHVTNHELQGKLLPNYQGIHLAGSLKICKSLAINRNWDKAALHLYKVKVNTAILKPLLSKIDLMDWSASSIAKLLLTAYYDTTIQGAAENKEKDNTNWHYNIAAADAINIPKARLKKLDEIDVKVLKYCAKRAPHTTKEDLDEIAALLAKLGYNSIIYKNYGENSLGEPCLLLFDDSVIISYEEIDTLILFEATEKSKLKQSSKIFDIVDRPWTYSEISFWKNTADNRNNALITFNGKLTRLRAGILIIKDDMVLLSAEAGNEVEFSIPGGGLEPNETVVEAAVREAQEEVRITVKNAVDTGYDYCECREVVEPWVKNNVPKNTQWYNYYTSLILAEYDKMYTGKIDKVDLDPSMAKNSKWYKIKDAIKLPTFKSAWKKALIDFGYYKPSLTEDVMSYNKKIQKLLLDNYAVQNFVKTPASVFIFRDGSIASADYHADMLDTLYDEDLIDDDEYNYYGSDFVVMETGAVRASYLADWENYIELPYDSMTSSQYERLYELLDLSQRLYDKVQIAVRGYRNRHITYSFAEYTTDDIIKKIKRYFASGQLYEKTSTLIASKHSKTFTEAAHSKYYYKNIEIEEVTDYDWTGFFINLPKYYDKEFSSRLEAETFIDSYLCSLTEAKSVNPLETAAIEQYGTTTNPLYAGYILSMGSLLDFSEGQRMRTLDHRDVASLYDANMYNSHSSSDLMLDFMVNTGAIRFLPELPGVCLVLPPTDQQCTALRQIARKISTIGFTVEIWNKLGNSVASWDYNTYVSGETICLDIAAYFSGKSTAARQLVEDTRTALLAKSRTAGPYKIQIKGKNRFERKKYSKVANFVKQYNRINMDDFFKKDILLIEVPVAGETNSYLVSIKLEGVCAEIQNNIKANNNKFEFRTIVQALSKSFNSNNVFIKCTCDDYKYRFSHWNIVNNVSVDDTSKDPGPGKGIRNPNDSLGRGCKHILAVLNNLDWLMKVASVINNYIHYAEEKMQKPFLNIIFPKLYGIAAEDMIDQDLIDDDKFLDSSAGLIDAINAYGRDRGKYRKGSNKNPVTKTGGKTTV